MTTPAFHITTDPAAIPFPAALALIRLTDWHANIPGPVFRTACDRSLCFGLFAPDAPSGDWPHPLVGFARVVGDGATYAYLCDVIVHPDWRGRGYSRRLVEATLAHPEVAGVRRYALLTRHAAGLYRKYGFEDGEPGVTWLERRIRKHGRLDAPAEFGDAERPDHVTEAAQNPACMRSATNWIGGSAATSVQVRS